jgi:hypothetical protein
MMSLRKIYRQELRDFMNKLLNEEIECNMFDDEFEKKNPQVNIRLIWNRNLRRVFVMKNDIRRIRKRHQKMGVKSIERNIIRI